MKIKKTNNGPREYQYYRCTKYNLPGHPRTRVTEAELDRQVLAFFDKMRIEDDDVRHWFRAVLASKTKDAQADSRAQRAELQRQESLLAAQQDRLSTSLTVSKTVPKPDTILLADFELF